MANKGESTSQIVERIIDSLSEAVSQFVVLVIALQEQNAEMPAQLPSAAGNVSQACTVLETAATSLANDEYGDYPEIQQQMLAAVDGVNKSSSGMMAAVNNMKSTPNRQQGWDRLVDACKIIAGKTILLLQIVYGAELKRLFASADLTQDSLKKVNPNNMGDPNDFAARASDAASNANQLAQQLRDKDEPNPQRRKELDDLADALQDDAEKIIEKTNEFLQDPDDPKTKKNLQDILDKTKRDVEKALDPLRSDHKRAQDAIDQLQGIYAKDPNFNKLFPQPKPSQKPPPASNDDRIKAAAEEAARAADNLRDAAKKPDRNGADKAGNDLVRAVDKLGEPMRDKAAKSHDPAERKRLLDALDDVEQLVPQNLRTANDTLSKPKDAPTQKKLDDANHDIHDALKDCVDPSRRKSAAQPPKNNNNNNNRQQDQYKPADYEKASKPRERGPNDPRSNGPSREDLIKADQLLPKLEDAVNNYRKNPNDPKARKQLEDILDQLEDPAENIFAPGPRDPHSRAKDKTRDLKNTLDDLENAARKGDNKGVADAARKAADQKKDLENDMKKLMDKEKNPERKRRGLDALNDLEQLLPQNIKAAQKLAQNPKDAQARQELADTNDALDKALDRAGRAADPDNGRGIEDAAKRGKEAGQRLGKNPKDQQALRDLEDAGDELIDRGREEEPHIKDPNRRKDLADALRDLEDLLGKLNADAEKAKANPNDKAAAKQLQDDIDKFNKLADKIRDATNSKPRADLDAVEDDLEDIRAAAHREDPKALHDAVRQLAEDQKEAAKSGKEAAAKEKDPARKKQLLEGIDEMEKLLPDMIKKAQEVIKNPKDKKAQRDLNEAVDNYKIPILKQRRAMDPRPKEDADKWLKDALAGLRKVRDRAAAGDKPGTTEAVKNVQPPIDKLKEMAKQVAKDTKDPKRRNDLQNALDDLDKLLKDLENKAKDAAANPNDRQKQSDLEDAIRETEKPLQKIADAIADEQKEEGNKNKKAAATLAALRGARKKQLDPSSLLEAADSLAACLKGMLSDVRSKAYSGGAVSEAAGKALSLADLLAELDKAASGNSSSKPPQKNKEDISGLLKGLDDLADAVAPGPGASLEQTINYVASSLVKRTRGMNDEPTRHHTDSIAAELAKLAESVRSGKKSEFLVSARKIAALVNAYNLEITKMANSCRDPELKQRMIDNGQALKNFSVQLKILASVKAASSGSDGKDAESQLGVLMNNLGIMMNATVSHVQIYRIKEKK